ncbi:MAG: NDP-sugar synthase, partial [candidate division Zixibacteria bacterium]
MKAILMAGGFGTRLRPLTINQAKPMVPVGNIPIMEHVVSLLASYGITDITSLLYFQPEDIKNYFGDGSRFGVSMNYVIPDADYGTAGAVRCALDKLDDSVLVISGDLITGFDLGDAMKWHSEQRAEATILLTHIENPLPYGIVITNPDGRIVRFLEKPSWGEAFSDTINTGIYILEPSALSLIPEKTNFDFSQNLYPLMLSRQMQLYGKIMEGYWKDIGNVNEYRLVHSDLCSGRLELDLKTEMTNRGIDRIFRGSNSTLEGGVECAGTVIIGDDDDVERGRRLRDCSIGARTRVGNDCRITDSIIWADNQIGHDSTIEKAIVCNRSRLGKSVHLAERVIVSDNCAIGDGAKVKV